MYSKIKCYVLALAYERKRERLSPVHILFKLKKIVCFIIFFSWNWLPWCLSSPAMWLIEFWPFVTYLQAPAPIFTTKRHFSMIIIFCWVFWRYVKWCMCDCCCDRCLIVDRWCCAVVIASYFVLLRLRWRVFTPITPRCTEFWQILQRRRKVDGARG